MKRIAFIISLLLFTTALWINAGDLGSFVSSINIDAMDSIANWALTKGDGDTASVATAATPYGTGLKLDYSFGTGGWAQINKSVQYWSFNGTEKVQFYYRKTGSSELLSVKFKDSDGDLLKYSLGALGDTSGWQQVLISFSSFTIDTASVGNGSFNWGSVQSFEFTFDRSEGGSGTFDVDDIYIVADNSGLWDDFEDGADPNLFGGTIGTWPGGSGNGKVFPVYVSTVSYRGSRSLEIKYDINLDAASMWITGNNKNMTGMDKLTFKVRGAAGNENVLLILKDTPTSTICQDYINVSSFTGISQVKQTWQQVTIDLSAYQGKLSQIESLNIEIPASLAGKTGTIYIDDLAFYSSVTQQSYYLDDMDTPVSNTSWAGYAAATASSSLSVIEGFKKSAARMAYSFGETGTWVNMTRKSSINLSYVKAIYAYIKQSGDRNYIEVKLQDSAGTVYYHKRQYDDMDTYFTLKAPIEDFKYFQGASGAKLNLKEITNIQLTVSKANGTSGNVIFDTILAGTETDFFNDLNASDVITKVEVVNNPFTPDGDGFRDNSRILFTLSEQATIRLRVYDLKGIVLYEREAEFNAGTGEYTWDGKNNDGTLQRSGLYIYQLYANSITGRTQKFNHIIGIEK